MFASRTSSSLVVFFGSSVAAAALLGLLAARSPYIAFAALVAGAATAGLLFVPLDRAAAIALAGVLVVPAALVESRAHGLSLSATPLGGQASMIVFLVAVLSARRILAGEPLSMRGGGAVALFLAAILGSVGVSLFRGSLYGGLVSDLYRQIAYVSAVVIGAIAVDACRRSGSVLAVFRGVAKITIAAGLLAVAYWLWARFGAPGSLTLFRDVRATSAFSAERAIFPFAEDSPNLGAIILVMMGAFSLPPLLASAARADRRLATYLMLAVVGGVLATESRSGLVALAALPVPYLILSQKNRLRTFVWVGIVALLAIQLYSLFPSDRRFSNTANLDVRQQIWSQAWGKFDEQPIVGQGYRYAARDQFYEAVPNPAIGAPGARLYSIHSDYLEQLVDGGVVGAGLFAAVLLFFVGTGMRLVRLGAGLRAPGIGYLSMLSVLFVSMITSAVWQSAAASIFIWLFFGIAAAIVAQPDVEDVS